jgi:hypothetical protein
VALIEDPRLVWTPAYSTVAGGLPLRDLPAVGAQGLTLVRFQLEASAGGPIRLKLQRPGAINVWMDRTPLDGRDQIETTIATGLHTMTLAFDSRASRSGLSVELEDVPDSPARVRLVGGK